MSVPDDDEIRNLPTDNNDSDDTDIDNIARERAADERRAAGERRRELRREESSVRNIAKAIETQLAAKEAKRRQTATGAPLALVVKMLVDKNEVSKAARTIEESIESALKEEKTAITTLSKSGIAIGAATKAELSKTVSDAQVKVAKTLEQFERGRGLMWKNLWGKVREVFGRFFSELKETLSEMASWFKGPFMGALITGFGPMGQLLFLLEQSGFFRQIKSLAGSLFQGMYKKGKEAVQTVIALPAKLGEEGKRKGGVLGGLLSFLGFLLPLLLPLLAGVLISFLISKFKPLLHWLIDKYVPQGLKKILHKLVDWIANPLIGGLLSILAALLFKFGPMLLTRAGIWILRMLATRLIPWLFSTVLPWLWNSVLVPLFTFLFTTPAGWIVDAVIAALLLIFGGVAISRWGDKIAEKLKEILLKIWDFIFKLLPLPEDLEKTLKGIFAKWPEKEFLNFFAVLTPIVNIGYLIHEMLVKKKKPLELLQEQFQNLVKILDYLKEGFAALVKHLPIADELKKKIEEVINKFPTKEFLKFIAIFSPLLSLGYLIAQLARGKSVSEISKENSQIIVKVISWFKKAFSTWGEALEQMWTKIKPKLGVLGSIIQIVINIFKILYNRFLEFIAIISIPLQKVVDWLKEHLAWLDPYVKAFIEFNKAIWEEFKNWWSKFVEAFKEAWNKTVGLLQKGWQWITSGFKKVEEYTTAQAQAVEAERKTVETAAEAARQSGVSVSEGYKMIADALDSQNQYLAAQTAKLDAIANHTGATANAQSELVGTTKEMSEATKKSVALQDEAARQAKYE